jgi:pRiA4b ORF-3-like protein
MGWGVPDFEDFGDIEVIDETAVAVSKLLKDEGRTVLYVYDSGDNWRHEVVREKILPDSPPPKPVCIGGERRCPPDDVGGPSGYQDFLEAIFDPEHEEFEHFRQWAGDPFHAEEFDLKAVNAILDRMRWPKRHRRKP